MKNLHLVHVGKCAGESVMDALKSHGVPFKNYHVGQACRDIADQVLAGDENNLFIILTRDPISRFVSAFEWDLLEKVIAKQKPPELPVWRLVFDTFPNANNLAESLTSPDAELRRNAEIAMRSSSLHIQMDLGWYLPPHIAAYLHKGNAFVVRTESINEDFRRLMALLDVEVADDYSVPLSKNNYKSRIPESRLTKTLSAIGTRNIKSYSLASYQTINILQENGLITVHSAKEVS